MNALRSTMKIQLSCLQDPSRHSFDVMDEQLWHVIPWVDTMAH